MDLFARLNPPCSECVQLDPKPIDSGARYCWGEMSWRGPEERVEGCVYRDQPCRRVERAPGTREDALRDLLTSPRHSIDAKGKRWLRAELATLTR